MHRSLRILFAILNASQRKRGIYITLLIALQSILDFFSLASFLPLIFFIVNPTLVASNSILKKLYPFQEADNSISYILFLTAIILIFILLKNMLSLVIARAKAKYAYGIGADLAERTMHWYTQKSYFDFSKADFAKEVNLIANYPFAFSTNVIIPATTLISELIVCLLILAGMAYYDYKILLALSVIIIPILIFYHFRKNGLQKVRTVMKEQYPLLLKYTLQMVEGLIAIKASAREGFFKNRFSRANDMLADAFVRDHVIQTSTTRLTEIVAAFIICILVAYAVITQKDFQHTILLLSIYASASFRAIPSINRILHSGLQYRTHEHLIHEFEMLSKDRYEVLDTSSRSTMSFHQKIELKNISIRYPEGPQVLRQLNLSINRGEKIALTGESGEGKSTLLLTLLGFLHPESGDILIDDVKVDDMRSSRGVIGYVPQTPFLLDGSVAENIAFGIPHDKIDYAKINQLINDLELEWFVDNLPQKVDTRIGEKGVKISGGQRQRLAIARALYDNADILLLDEVTNQVHASLEKDIMSILHNLAMEGKTIILVTHKIHDPFFFDAIYHLEKGSLKKTPAYS